MQILVSVVNVVLMFKEFTDRDAARFEQDTMQPVLNHYTTTMSSLT